MAFRRKDSFTVYTGTDVGATSTHVLSDEMSMVNQVDDILIISVAIDGSVSPTVPSDWTAIVNNNTQAHTHLVIWKRATGANETMPDITLSGNEELAAHAIAIVGCPTGSTPIGNTATKSGNSITPTWDTISYSADSYILYFCAMDADGPLTAGSKAVLAGDDYGSVGTLTAYEFVASAGSTGSITGSATLTDGWQTLTLEILDDGTGNIPIYFQNQPAASLSTDLGTVDDFRDTLVDSGINYFDGGSVRTVTFDASTANTTTNEVTSTAHSFTNGDVVRIRANGATLPTGLTDGEYYYADVTDANTLSFHGPIAAPANTNTDYYPSTSELSITAVGSGSCAIDDVGFLWGNYELDRLDRPSTGHETGNNRYIGGQRFSSPYDFSDGAFAAVIDSVNALEVQFIFIDDAGNYKTFLVATDEYPNDESLVQIDLENSNLEACSSGTLDHTSIEYVLISALRKAVDDRTNLPYWYSSQTYKTTTAVVLGEGSIDDVYNELIVFNSDLAVNGSNLDLHYTFLSSLRLGGGHLTTDPDLTFSTDSVSVIFPPLANGTTRLTNYLTSLGISVDINEDSSVSATNILWGASTPFGYSVDADSPSGAVITLNGSILVNSDASFTSNDTLERLSFINGVRPELNGCTLSSCTFKDIDNSSGYVLLSTSDTLIDPVFEATTATDYAIEIDTAGDYTFDNFTFTGFTTDVNVTATTGVVNLTIDGGDTPTITSAGATVNLLIPPVDIAAPNLIDGTRVLLRNDTSDTTIDNSVVSGGIGYSYTTVSGDASDGDTIKLFATYQSGTTAKKEMELLGTFSASGISFPNSQEDEDVYSDIGIDGSTVTEFTADGVNVQVDIDDADGLTTKDRLVAWWFYNLTTATGIATYFGGLTIEDDANFKVNADIVDLKLDNVSGSPVLFTDHKRLYRDDDETIIASTSDSIQLDAGKVYIAESGVSGLTAQESEKLDDVHKIHGLDIANPMTVTENSRFVGSINQAITGDGETITTVTRT